MLGLGLGIFQVAVRDVGDGDLFADAALDFNGDLGVTDSAGAVSSWVDQASLVPFSQSSASKKPTTNTVSINGHNAITFDGVVDYLENNNNDPIGLSPTTVFFVHVPETAAIGGRLLSNAGSGSGKTRFYHGSFSCDFGNTTLLWPTPSAGDVIIQCASVDGGAGTHSQYLTINGAPEITSSVGRNPRGNTLRIGASSVSGGFYQGSILRELAYPSFLSVAEKNKIGNALAALYGGTWVDLL